MYLSIKPDSIFVADSHFNEKNRELLILLKKVESKEIVTSQLFLMGDIFDFIMKEKNINLPTAVKFVADCLGVKYE